MKKHLISFLLILSTTLCGLAQASDFPNSGTQSYVSAKVYFLTWQFMSADAPRTAQDTRGDYHELIVMNDEFALKRFISWLDLADLKEGQVANGRNVLLVVDLMRADGHIDSYYSDGCLLFSSDLKLSRTVDESFRKQFDFVGGNLLMHTRTRDYHLCESNK